MFSAAAQTASATSHFRATNYSNDHLCIVVARTYLLETESRLEASPQSECLRLTYSSLTRVSVVLFHPRSQVCDLYRDIPSDFTD
jgi:hypothetical protein